MLSDKCSKYSYQLLLLLSHFCCIYIINTDNNLLLIILFLLSFISAFIKRDRITKQDITLSRVVCIAISIILFSFTGSILSSTAHLVLSLLLSIPASLTAFDFCKVFEKLFTSNKRNTVRIIDKLSLKEYLICIITAFFSITLMSTSSPLYPFNIWDDTNVYFTMGRVVLGGMVPYRDVYEQKGPIWFFIQALCALISDNSFIGVYILETVMCSLFIIFSWKITKLFISIEEHEYYVLGVMILSGIIYSSNMFHLGGSTEEFAFPLLAIVMYIALKALIQDKTLPSVKEALIVGLITGSLFWIKFTLCAFIVGFVFFFFVYAITIKKNRELLRLICTFLVGFIIVTIPILIYYGINSSINDLINVYFIDNIVVHSGINTTGNDYLLTLIHKLKLFTVGFGILYKPNIALLFLILISVILFSIYKKRITVYLLLSYSITHLVCFMKDGVIIFYYGFPLVVFSALTLIPITLALKIVNERLKAKTTIASTVLISAVIVCFVSCILNSKNTTLLGKPYEETPQYIFSQEITKTDNPRILTYDVMDSGFLTASGALPSNRFYCSLIILNHLPEAQQERDHLIEDGYFDYIVAYRNDYEWNNYEVISSAEYAIPYPSGNTYSQVYYLYKRDDLI